MSDSSATPSPSSAPCEGHLWDVQEILAERTSVTGENELLVVWKTSWIPYSNMIADGPVMRRFKNAPKWNFSSAAGAMRIILPIEPGTMLAQDCAVIVNAADTARADAVRAEPHQTANNRATNLDQSNNTQHSDGTCQRRRNTDTGIQ